MNYDVQPILSSDDLRKLLLLVSRATITVADVPNFWLSVQRLESASKLGADYGPLGAKEASEVDGNRV